MNMKFTFSGVKKLMTEPRIPIGIFILFVVLAMFVTQYAVFFREKENDFLTRAPYTIEEEIYAGNLALTIHSVRRDPIGVGPLTPRTGYQFVVADITLKNNGQDQFDLIPLLQFYVKDNEGKVYTVALAPSEMNARSGPIPPHDLIREEIGFEVAKDAEGLALYLETGEPGQPVIVVNLGK